ncbi:hypothetical protein LVJ82_17230 [Vitreoscilla massiliensis]|uniref:Large polyvalent protein-associated domain-containing protein n=1 Tax=Vitreoscilla massiliensis TaxID=1689272 RepID=A0ABY4E4F7_9NEIS|nr:LPD1 domain-containing protein [Vitreoscilla massiliensis]UOO89163.1 hypothetical protein LVJ82_17230 [Vitreoscilla massiliensis]
MTVITLTPMEKLQLNGQLKNAIDARNAAEDPVERLSLIKTVQELRAKLGLSSSIVNEPEPIADTNAKDEEQKQEQTIIDEETETNDDLSDVTTADNYRWRDTAYIAGARKELAQKSILQAKRDGKKLNVSDIDWDELVSDPRLSESLIVKENIFGRVDWPDLSEKGMPSEVAYFISRVYANIDKVPLNPLHQTSQKNYVQAVSNIRERLESCRTFKEVVEVMNDIIQAIPSSKLMKMLYDDELATGISLLENIETNYQHLSQSTKDKALSYEGQIWAELGEKFSSWLRKSVNVTLRKAQRESKYKEWASWCSDFKNGTDSEGNPTPEGAKRPRKQSFQLEAATDIERIGGKEVDLQSSKQLEEMFGFKGIQSGNWVLKDKSAAEFHMKNAAAAMLDMSDVLGIEPKYLGLKGNLALAFGARGKAGALAHYEPSTKVINITKMRGGGSLGHEYFHAIDNLIKDLSTQSVGSAKFMGTSNPEELPDKDLSSAFKALQTALKVQENVLVYDFNKHYIEDVDNVSDIRKRTIESHARSIMRISGVDEKTASIEEMNRGLAKGAASMVGMNASLRPRYAAAALLSRYWALGEQSGVSIVGGVLTHEIDGFSADSEFVQAAIALDEGKVDKYWSKDYEMAARAFSAYLQDRLEEQGRKNDYLAYSTKGGNGRAGEIAYPQGQERLRINAAFDAVFAVIREKKVFETASENTALMDSLFSSN